MRVAITTVAEIPVSQSATNLLLSPIGVTYSLAVESKKGPNVEEIGIVTILVSKYVKCFTL